MQRIDLNLTELATLQIALATSIDRLENNEDGCEDEIPLFAELAKKLKAYEDAERRLIFAKERKDKYESG